MKWPRLPFKLSIFQTWMLFFILTVSPMLGNSIAYGWFDSRRPLQLIILIICSMGLLISSDLKSLRHITHYMKWPFIFSLISTGLALLVGYFQPDPEEPFSFNLEDWQKLSLNILLLTIFATFLYFCFIHRKEIRKVLSLPQQNSNSLPWLLAVGAIGMIMAFKAWIIGPAELQAHIDLAGSTTIVGLCASIGYFVIIFSLPTNFFIKFITSLPFIYLLFFSTSRTAYLVFFIFWAIFAIRQLSQLFKRNKSQKFHQRILLFLLPVFSLIFILAPLKIHTPYYPYYVSQDTVGKIWLLDGEVARISEVGQDDLISYRREELWNRMSRFLRILYTFYQSKFMQDLRVGINSYFDVDLLPEIFVDAKDFVVISGHDPLTRWQRMKAQSMRQESRSEIIKKTYGLITERPHGWWPENYSNSISFYCNAERKCQYPHNIILEVTFYFGVFIGSVYFLMLGAIAWILLKFALLSTSPLITGISVSLLVYLCGAQFTGTFYDLIIAAFLFINLLILLSRCIREGQRTG